MDLEKEIANILFRIGQEVKIHKIDNDNMILEIDYDRYVGDILEVFQAFLDE